MERRRGFFGGLGRTSRRRGRGRKKKGVKGGFLKEAWRGSIREARSKARVPDKNLWETSNSRFSMFGFSIMDVLLMLPFMGLLFIVIVVAEARK